ncbi:MAG TPA: hypothetical protein PLO61_11310 [Fimbriimonadaceae bacterium]|nr:hypothetical protein [Fimbriimonadaceae bacterium]HRJ34259.1 hypothetical protein [Fimbriimonadaceae bacterium]
MSTPQPPGPSPEPEPRPAPESPVSRDAKSEPTAKRPSKPMPGWMRWAIVGAVILITFLLQGWMGDRRTEAARRDAFLQGVRGLSAALVQPMLQRDSARLQRTLEQIASAGPYSVVVVTDARGLVVASTDRTLENKTLDSLRRPPIQSPKFERLSDRIRAETAIVIGGDNVLGGLRVESKVGS